MGSQVNEPICVIHVCMWFFYIWLFESVYLAFNNYQKEIIDIALL